MATLNTDGVNSQNANNCTHEDPCVHNEPRGQIESSKIVVHGARIKCSMAETSKKNTRLSVKDGYGYIQGGKLCAHDQSCIPVSNIPFFSGCISYDVERVITALYDKASEEMKTRYDAALKAVKANQPSRGRVTVPCTLPLLDRWFDADEKEVVTKSIQVGSDIAFNLRVLKNEMIGKLSSDISTTYFISKANEPVDSLTYTKEQSKEYGEISKSLTEIKNQIENKVTDFLSTFDIYVPIKGENFEEIVTQLQSAKYFIKQVGLDWESAHNIYSDLTEYEKYADKFGRIVDGEDGWQDGELNKEIDKIIEEIRNWKLEEFHLILDDSFLVCRCGGIISFLDSGQDFCMMADNLEASILKLVTRFKEHCQGSDIVLADRNEAKKINDSFHDAAKGLEKFENLIMGKEDTSSIKSCVYMELICKSYNDEVKKARMSILSLLTFIPGMNVLSLALAIYTIATMEKNAQGAIDGISADISSLEAVASISEYGAGAIVEFNNTYTLLSSIVNFFYISYDTQIEDVRITVFTDNYAHILDRKLTKTGELDDGVDIFWIHTKEEYEREGIGRGLSWKEKPGVYLDRLITNKGGNGNVKKEYSEEWKREIDF